MYDLTRQNWIPVTLTDATQTTMGFRDILTHSHTVAELNVNDPLVESGMLRILAGLLYRVVDLDHSQSLDVWKDQRSELFERAIGGEPIDHRRVNDYFDQWEHRFDLFDNKRPWLQDARLRGVDKEYDPENPSETVTEDKTSKTKAENNGFGSLDIMLFASPMIRPHPATLHPGEAALLLTANRLYLAGKIATARRYFKNNSHALFLETIKKNGKWVTSTKEITSHAAGSHRNTVSHFPRFGNLYLDLIASLVHPSAWGSEYSAENDLAPWETTSGADREIGGFLVNRNCGFVSELTATNVTDSLLFHSADFTAVIGCKTAGSMPNNGFFKVAEEAAKGEGVKLTDQGWLPTDLPSRPRDPFVQVVTRTADDEQDKYVFARPKLSPSAWRNLGESLTAHKASAGVFAPRALMDAMELAEEYRDKLRTPMQVLSIRHAGEPGKAIDYNVVRSVVAAGFDFGDPVSRQFIPVIVNYAEMYGDLYLTALSLLSGDKKSGAIDLDVERSDYWSKCDSTWNGIIESVDFSNPDLVAVHNNVARYSNKAFYRLALDCLVKTGLQAVGCRRLIALGEATSRIERAKASEDRKLAPQAKKTVAAPLVPVISTTQQESA